MGTIYSPLKIFQYQKHFAALQSNEVVPPVHIRIKPINACNHNCWYCAYRYDNVQLGSDMNVRDRIPKDKMAEIVRDIVDMRVQAVTFSGGGEPLAYPQIAETALALAEGGVKIATLSNGAFLSGETAQVFSKWGTWVRVSVDAWDGPSYVKSRGVRADAFDKLLQNLQNFSNLGGKCSLGLSFIIGKNNAPHIYEAMAKFKAVGIKHVKLYGVVTGNTIPENNLYHSEIQETVKAEIKKCKAELESPDFVLADQYHLWEENFKKDYQTCGSLQFLTVIGADCKVYACQDKAYTDSGMLGSIKERSFKEFWFSDENRKRLKEIDPSRDCQHHCVSHRKNLLINEYSNLEQGHSAFV